MILYVFIQSSCAINKFIPEGKVLLTKNQVKLEDSELTRKKADRNRIRYVISNPEYGLGKSYLYFYFKHSDPGDTTWWDRLFINKLSERPQWLDTTQILQNQSDLVKHLNAAGYYQGSVLYKVAQKNKKASVTYTVSPGRALKVNSITYSCENPHIQGLLDSLKPLLRMQPGLPLDEQLLYPDQALIIHTLQDAGYFQLGKANFDYYFSDSTNQSIDLKCTILSADAQTGFEQFRIAQINVYSFDRLSNPVHRADTTINRIQYHESDQAQALRPNILEKYLKFDKGDLYNLSALQQTRNSLQNLGIYRNISIIPERSGENELDVSLHLPAVKKQFFQVDLESSYVTNRDQAAGNKLFDFRVALQYRHRNLFRGAEQFTVSIIPNIGLQAISKKILVPWGLNTQVSLTVPRFWEIGFVRFANQIGLMSDRFYENIKTATRTRISVGNVYDLFYNFYNGRNEQSVQRETKASFGYEFSKDNRIFYRFNPIGFDYLNYDLSPGFDSLAPQFLRKSFEDRLLTGIFIKEITADINKQYSNNNSSRILISLETSGLEAGAINLFSNKQILPKVSRFVRSEVDARYTWRLSRTDDIGLRLATGLALPFGREDNAIPFVRQFYVGGPNSIRGWAIREIGPGIVKNEQAAINRFSFYQTGNFKLEFGSEYRFDIFSILKGAFLFDGGNVWILKKDPLLPGGELSTKFLSQLYLSTGFGLRLDFTFFLIRFDSGVKLRTPYLQENGTHRPPTRSLRDLQYNLSLGLPF